MVIISNNTHWSSFRVSPIGHPQRRLFLFGKQRWEHPPRKPRRSTVHRFKNSGWRDEWYAWISIGKCKSMCTFRKPFPVTLLAAEMLFVFQSVQYKWSSNSVNANGCGKWLLKIYKGKGNNVTLIEPIRSLLSGVEIYLFAIGSIKMWTLDHMMFGICPINASTRIIDSQTIGPENAIRYDDPSIRPIHISAFNFRFQSCGRRNSRAWLLRCE